MQGNLDAVCAPTLDRARVAHAKALAEVTQDPQNDPALLTGDYLNRLLVAARKAAGC